MTVPVTDPAVAGNLIIAANPDRRRVTIENEGANPLYIGPIGFTAAAGLLLAGGAHTSVTLVTRAAIYGIATGGTDDVRYLEEAV